MKKILNRTFLKLLAITAMTCDHAALAFLSSGASEKKSVKRQQTVIK